MSDRFFGKRREKHLICNKNRALLTLDVEMDYLSIFSVKKG